MKNSDYYLAKLVEMRRNNVETIEDVCRTCGEHTTLERLGVFSVSALGGFRCAAHGCEWEISESEIADPFAVVNTRRNLFQVG